MVVASASGGMAIEEIAARDPDAIVRVNVEPAVGLQAFEAREIAFAVGLDASLVPQAVQMMTGCYRVFGELDATMLEINPLAVTADGRLLALDAKMTFDDNALFRHQDVSELRDKSQEDPRERTAVDRGLSYVGLEGNIGCIINGAGLAMATMDMIKHAGGEPANFLDIGGGRLSRAGAEGVPAGALRRQRRGRAGEHLRGHQPLRLGGRGRGPGPRAVGAVGSGSGAAVGHQRRGGTAHPGGGRCGSGHSGLTG